MGVRAFGVQFMQCFTINIEELFVCLIFFSTSSNRKLLKIVAVRYHLQVWPQDSHSGSSMENETQDKRNVANQ